MVFELSDRTHTHTYCICTNSNYFIKREKNPIYKGNYNTKFWYFYFCPSYIYFFKDGKFIVGLHPVTFRLTKKIILLYIKLVDYFFIY